jgi:hypothetical protein
VIEGREGSVERETAGNDPLVCAASGAVLPPCVSPTHAYSTAPMHLPYVPSLQSKEASLTTPSPARRQRTAAPSAPLCAASTRAPQ